MDQAGAQQNITVIAPIATLGLSDLHRSELKAFLQSYPASLAGRWPSAEPMTVKMQATGRQPTLHQRMALSKYFATGFPIAASPATQNLTVVKPVLCRLGRHGVLFLQTTIVSAEGIHSRQSHRLAANAFPDATAVTTPERFPVLLGEILREADAGRRPATLMKLSFFSRRPLLGQPKADSTCLNLLLAESLQDDVRILPDASGFELQQLYDAMGMNEPSKRHSRVLSVDWRLNNDEWEFPKAMDLQANLVESVITASSPPASDAIFALRFAANGAANRLEIGGSRPLSNALRQAASKLLPTLDPAAIAANGSWIYLDVGRAYGLTMNDRLVGKDDPEIKGHVVGFFGPEAGLKDADGTPVHEGAILFIRRNLKNVAIGSTFRFDPQTYPAAGAP